MLQANKFWHCHCNQFNCNKWHYLIAFQMNIVNSVMQCLSSIIYIILVFVYGMHAMINGCSQNCMRFVFQNVCIRTVYVSFTYQSERWVAYCYYEKQIEHKSQQSFLSMWMYASKYRIQYWQYFHIWPTICAFQVF